MPIIIFRSLALTVVEKSHECQNSETAKHIAYNHEKRRNSLLDHLQILKLPDGVQASNNM